MASERPGKIFLTRGQCDTLARVPPSAITNKVYEFRRREAGGIWHGIENAGNDISIRALAGLCAKAEDKKFSISIR